MLARVRVNEPDTDGDFVPDWFEFHEGSDAFNPDTDGDGTPDGAEYASGTDPADPSSLPSSPDGGTLPGGFLADPLPRLELRYASFSYESEDDEGFGHAEASDRTERVLPDVGDITDPGKAVAFLDIATSILGGWVDTEEFYRLTGYSYTHQGIGFTSSFGFEVVVEEDEPAHTFSNALGGVFEVRVALDRAHWRPVTMRYILAENNVVIGAGGEPRLQLVSAEPLSITVPSGALISEIVRFEMPATSTDRRVRLIPIHLSQSELGTDGLAVTRMNAFTGSSLNHQIPTTFGVRFCRWTNAFPKSQDFRFNDTFISGDRDRFRVQVPFALGFPAVTTAYISTHDREGRILDPETRVSLASPGSLAMPEHSPRLRQSVPLALVTDAVDDQYNAGSDIPGDEGVDDTTHRATLGGTVDVRFPELTDAVVSFPVMPPKAILSVKVRSVIKDAVLGENFGNKLNEHLPALRNIYAQVGIEVDTGLRIKPTDSTSDEFFADGEFDGGYNIDTFPDPYQEPRYLVEKFSKQNPEEPTLFYVPVKLFNAGIPAFGLAHTDPRFDLFGHAYIEFEDSDASTMAHELAHVLLARPGHYDDGQLPQRFNIVARTGGNQGDYAADSKRIAPEQENVFFKSRFVKKRR